MTWGPLFPWLCRRESTTGLDGLCPGRGEFRDPPEEIRVDPEDGFATPRAELAANLRVLVAADTARVAVIDVDGTVAAFGITTTVFGLENGLVAELEDLYVAPHARRRGLARQLIDDSAAWARARSAHRLNITIAPNGLDVSHLLRYYTAARGFRDEGRRIITLALRDWGSAGTC